MTLARCSFLAGTVLEEGSSVRFSWIESRKRRLFLSLSRRFFVKVPAICPRSRLPSSTISSAGYGAIRASMPSAASLWNRIARLASLSSDAITVPLRSELISPPPRPDGPRGQPEHGSRRDREPGKEGDVHHLPAQRLQQHPGAEGAGEADRENGHVVRRLSAAPFDRRIGGRQQRGPADVEEVPADTQQDERDRE